MNTSHTPTSMLPPRGKLDNQHQPGVEREPTPSQQSSQKSGDWRDHVHQELKQLSFDEQERVLAPPGEQDEAGQGEDTQTSPEVGAKDTGKPGFDSLKTGGTAPKKDAKRRPGPPKRKAPPPPQRKVRRIPGPPKRRAPPPPKRGADKVTGGGPKPLEPEAEVTPKVPPENTTVAARLEQGARGAELIRGGVLKAKEVWDAKKKQRDGVIAANAKAKKGVWSFLKKKAPEPPPLPSLDHAAAGAELERVQGVLRRDANKARGSAKPVPKKLLPASGDVVEMAAERMDTKVEAPHVEATRDLAVGLREGDEAMLGRFLTRGGKVMSSTVEITRSIAQNQEANVYEGKYLGMAPVAYKVSRQGADVPESEDPTLKEHGTMRSLEGDENVLQAGPQTVDRRGFIMALAKKGDLAGLRKHLAGEPLESRIAIWKHLMRGGFSALDKLHASGRSHGDVKNENMLLGDDYEPKLMDFGTTGADKDAKDSGTSTYMAPEIHQTKARKETDIWSMGESLLMGLFGMNSVDFAKGGIAPATNRFSEEVGKTDKVGNGAWLSNVEAKVKHLPDGAELIDFLKGVMAMEPKKRLTAKAALQHRFLKLQEGAANRGKERLRQLV